MDGRDAPRVTSGLRRLALVGVWEAARGKALGAAAPALAKLLDVEVLPLKLADPRFYHLDTCFCPLANGYTLYFPAALS